MKLYEFEGKKLFEKYEIAVPESALISERTPVHAIAYPVVLKAQVRSGGRKKAGGVLFADDAVSCAQQAKELFEKEFQGERAEKILVEPKIDITAEYYASISYDTNMRAPVLALSAEGGIEIDAAKTFPIDIIFGVPVFFVREALRRAGFQAEDVSGLIPIIQKLWQLFIKEYALLAEINPLVKTKTGTFVACDAKIILDLSLIHI